MNILIVDDSAVNLKIYGSLVKKLGSGEATCFSTSSTALEWASTHDIDLAIVDYNMPSPDGLEFIRLIRAMPEREGMAILMVTADHAKDVRYAALECGANDFLTKPIDAAEFSARVKNMLALRESQRQLSETANWLAEQVKAATAELATRERETIITLSIAAERRNPETGAHLARMAQYCEIIARGVGLPVAEQELILAAAPLHDMGKIAVPDYILLKPGKLTAAEFTIMKQHTVVGYDILRQSHSNILKLAAEIALTHHEKFDGSGYPRELSGTRIPLAGRICAVSDVFDALTSSRPYKDAWSIDDAVAEVNRNSGHHFDPELVEVFNSVLPELLHVKAKFPDNKVERLPLRPVRTIRQKRRARG
jgi:response regulator RpfG family c-di-GMP phosphodiesterase